jgi:hypothetical protein
MTEELDVMEVVEDVAGDDSRQDSQEFEVIFKALRLYLGCIFFLLF